MSRISTAERKPEKKGGGYDLYSRGKKGEGATNIPCTPTEGGRDEKMVAAHWLYKGKERGEGYPDHTKKNTPLFNATGEGKRGGGSTPSSLSKKGKRTSKPLSNLSLSGAKKKEGGRESSCLQH